MKQRAELAAQEKQKLVSQASLEAKKKRQCARRKAIEEILEGARKKLALAGKNKKYAETLDGWP